MFNYQPKLIALRGFLLAACLAALAGCGAADSSTPNPPQTTVPAQPSNLQATAGNASVSLTWTASSGATSYHVKRGTSSGGPYTQVAVPTAASYTDTSLTNGTIYFYVISAVNSAGESQDSAQASATPTAGATIPAAPAGLSATPGNTQVVLNWTREQRRRPATT